MVLDREGERMIGLRSLQQGDLSGSRGGRGLLLVALLLGGSGCAIRVPDIYLTDRHTVMESEAAGEWPQIDKRLRRDLHKGPVVLPPQEESRRQQRAFRILNGEYPSSTAPAAEPPLPQP